MVYNLVVTARKTVFSLNLTGAGHVRDRILGTSTAFSFVVPFWCIAMGETLQYAGWAVTLGFGMDMSLIITLHHAAMNKYTYACFHTLILSILATGVFRLFKPSLSS